MENNPFTMKPFGSQTGDSSGFSVFGESRVATGYGVGLGAAGYTFQNPEIVGSSPSISTTFTDPTQPFFSLLTSGSLFTTAPHNTTHSSPSFDHASATLDQTTRSFQSTTHQSMSNLSNDASSTTDSTSSAETETCPICLSSMKPGHHHTIFTAECSHAFHFHCIVSNVKHGNLICPVCRAKWNQVPFQGPTSRTNPFSRPLRVGRLAVVPTPEPTTFNDDESLDPQREVVGNLTRSIDIKSYPEFSVIQKSHSKENFTVLIHLKAPVASNIDKNEVSSQPTSQTSRAPIDLVTVLDVSGSMQGTKLALLKQAMGFVIQNLGPSDRLSVIAFESTARRLFPLCKMTDQGRQQAFQAVNSLYSNGGTNIAEGLRKAAKVMEDRREKNPVAGIILLSDGQDNTHSVHSYRRLQTQPDYRVLLPFSVLDRNSGFQLPIHAFGFGADHDAALMHSISELSGGTFSFIEDEGVIQDAFAQCIGGLLSVVVQDLRVSINCIHPDIRLGSLKAGSYATSIMDDARSGFINAGDLYAEEERDFLVLINIPVGDLSSETKLLNVHSVHRCPVTNETFTSESIEVKIQRPEIASEQGVSMEVDRQKNRVQAAEAMAEARIAAEQGDYSNAVLILENIRTILADTASARAGDELCAALDAELMDMQARMGSRNKYEVSGRAYGLSAMSSHSRQRATARGDSTSRATPLCSYQTPSMASMVSLSKNAFDHASTPAATSSSIPSSTRVIQPTLPIIAHTSATTIQSKPGVLNAASTTWFSGNPSSSLLPTNNQVDEAFTRSHTYPRSTPSELQLPQPDLNQTTNSEHSIAQHGISSMPIIDEDEIDLVV